MPIHPSVYVGVDLDIMDFYSQFSTTIDTYLKPGGRLVLAFSGGVDSRVLLQLVAKYSQRTETPCFAVHVHHGLSDNADLWAQNCQQWCQALDVDFYLEKVNLKLKGSSLEESAREARYASISQHLQEGDLLLTGQHSDDQLETFLLALKRGSGPKGLSSMAEQMPFGVADLVRPLLRISRQEIENYANDNRLDWVEDESNQDTRFDRNFIRHQIVPQLHQRWPHITKSVQRSSELCAEQEALLDELLTDKLTGAVYADGSLMVEALAAVSNLMRARLIRMWLAQFSVRMPSREQLNLIWHQVANAQQDANPSLNLPDGEIRRFAHRLYFVPSFNEVSNWQSALHVNQPIQLPDGLGRLTLSENNSGNLCLDALSSGTLGVQFNPEGLSAHPVERGHSRKLKKLFQEYAIPSWQRRRMPILMCGSKVAAIADLFVDRDFVGQDCELIWDKSSNVV